mmetsp:Transcript_163292/g.396870  ORF Transcript_163292/g.396870 Transcript_163292/m.396870 type:complete len:1278 (+) Transcript_163292:105-3938(+)
MYKAFTQKLLDIKTPSGSIGEWADYCKTLLTTTWQLLDIAGRDSIFLWANLVLSFLKVPLTMWIGRLWPWLSTVMDHGGDVGGVLFLMIQLSLLHCMVQYATNRLKDIFFARMLEHIQVVGVNKFCSMDTAFWDTCDPAQQVVVIFQQADRVKSFLGHIESLVQCVFTLGGGIIHVYTISPEATCVAVVLMVFICLYMHWLSRIIAMVSGAMDTTQSELKAGTMESLTNIRTVQAFACEGLEVVRFMGRKDKWWACRSAFVVTEGIRRGSEILIQHARVLALNYGGFLLVSRGRMQAGEVFILQAVLGELLVGTYDALIGTTRIISIDLIFAQVFLNMLNTPVKIPTEVGKVPGDEAKGSLSLQSVEFAYPARPDDRVLKGISIEIPAGSFTALVGRSGSGKTTIGRLLERFYDVQGGSICLDGHDLRSLQPRWLRQQIGYVEQEPKLFRGTIRENIMYGNPLASEAQIEEAARSAHVAAFTVHFPEGLDTEVGSGGQSLSGGQKQRVAIARAMLRSPSLVILDEATSALDNETERLIQEALERLMTGRTTLVIAHRLTTVRRADQIVVMRQGCIVERGTHAELISRQGGAYAGLMAHQQQGGPPQEEPPQGPQAPEAPEAPKALRAPEGGPPAEQQPQEGAPQGGGQGPWEGRAHPEPERPAPASAVEHFFDGVPRGDSFFPLLLWMYRLMGPRKWLLVACVLFSIAESRAKVLIGPKVLRAFATLESPAEYYPAFWDYAVVLLLGFVFKFVKERLKDFFEPHLVQSLQFQCLFKMLRQDVDYFGRNDPANIVPRAFDQAEMCAVCTTMTTENLIHCSASLIMLIYELYVLSPPVLLWTICLSLPATFIFWIMAMAEGRRMQPVEKADKELYAVVIESLTNVRTMHSFGGETLELSKFKQQKQRWWREEMFRRRIGWVNDAFGLSFTTFLGFVVIGVILRYHSGHKSSLLAALMWMVKSFFEEVAFLSISIGSMGAGKSAMSIISEILREPTAILADVGDTPGPRAEGSLEFQHVRFSYDSSPEKDVLCNVSFKIPVGSFTAIVGHSGSGKTTLGRLLMRFYDVKAGAILLDGRPLSSLNPQWLRKQIGYVEQEPKLFEETLWNNIRYGRYAEASDEDVWRAAAAAKVTDFVDTLPQGFLTNVGRFGQNLSGGQKQRVAIARTLLTDPALLLMDEATSALDSQTEHSVQEALDGAMAGRTSVVIAHRLSTVARAGQVVVLDAGRVAQVGGHQELAAQGGLYSQLMLSLQGPAGAEAGPGPEAAAGGGAEEGLRRRR